MSLVLAIAAPFVVIAALLAIHALVDHIAWRASQRRRPRGLYLPAGRARLGIDQDPTRRGNR